MTVTFAHTAKPKTAQELNEVVEAMFWHYHQQDAANIAEVISDKHPHLFNGIKSGLITEAINMSMANDELTNAVDTLDVLKTIDPALCDEVLQVLKTELELPTLLAVSSLTGVLQNFSNYPELHPIIHQHGREANIFAALLPAWPRTESNLFQAVGLYIGPAGFRYIIDTGERVEEGRNVVEDFKRLVAMSKPYRENAIDYSIPTIGALMAVAAEHPDLPEDLKPVAERELVKARDFLKPRGIAI